MTDELLPTKDAPVFTMTPPDLSRDKTVGPQAKALYALIATYTNTERQAYPSRSTLAESLVCSTDSIDRWVKELLTAGWMTRLIRKRKNGSYDSTLYQLLWVKKDSRTGTATPEKQSEWPHGYGHPSRTDTATPSRAGAATIAAPVRPELEPDELEPNELEPVNNKTIVQTDKSVSTSNADPTPSNAELFEEFWEVYDRKVGKGTARAAWKKALKKTTASALIHAASEHTSWHQRNGTETDKIPHPSTWLNGERWEDERPEPQGPVNSAQQRWDDNRGIIEQTARLQQQNGQRYNQPNQPLIRQIGK